MEKIIAHMDLDTFFVSAERLENSSLLGKPVIIGGFSDRGVVASCSYEARKFGVHAAMPGKLARRICPQAIWIRGDMDKYSRLSHLVTELITSEAPLVEKASIDEHYLDVTGMDRFFGTKKWMHELRMRIIKETGLPISFGLSVNKTVSKIATGEAKPNGEKEVVAPLVRPFLNPLSIKKIPGIGDKSYHTLRDMGIVYIETLSNMPPELLVRVMGENGKQIWEKANGIDNRPVQPYHEQKSIGSERTFETDTTDIKFLHEVLSKMVQDICFDMRKQNRLCATITLKLRYSDFQTHTAQVRVAYTSYDHVILTKAKELLTKLYDRRLLIRLIGVKVSNLVYGAQQINLFEDSVEMIKLYQALDQIKHWYGKKAIRKGG
ncbi:MAG: DNA polymerase IV [Sphingobacteriales bacterium]|jgi:DNA polymerase-4|nr:DNA polymerase IV [Sphingobacteriales bacterium]